MDQTGRRAKLTLEPLRYESSLIRVSPEQEQVAATAPPYAYAYPGTTPNHFLALHQDIDAEWLASFKLPALSTPQELADWLDVPLGKLAWLSGRFFEYGRPQAVQAAHYHFQWAEKRTDGKRAYRLIEAPKPLLAQVQQRILREILQQVRPHHSAHGFVAGRSIVTNARPHLGQRLVIKMDLENFYPSVRYSRVVAMFRTLGFSREVAIWLGRLTTSQLPFGLPTPNGQDWMMRPYRGRHLPQGAATSPALANLSAFPLDVRLTGFAKAYHLVYTRYADDLTFSGSGKVVPALKEFIPLAKQIVRDERFRLHPGKTRVVRNSCRQVVTGVVVNKRPNVSREYFDQLKAILHNCRVHGPSTQNRGRHANFAERLRGSIAHVQQLHAARGAKLLAIYDQIDWSK